MARIVFPLVQLPEKFKMLRSLYPHVRYVLFPLVQLPEKLKICAGAVSIGGAKFPLVQLPEKFKITVSKETLEENSSFH